MTETINHEEFDFEPNWMDKMAKIMLWVNGILLIASIIMLILLLTGVIEW